MTLTLEQIGLATRIGKQRQASNLQRRKKDAHGFKGNGEQIHINGAIAELAVAHYLGESWQAFSRSFEGIKSDVGGRYQVRSTTYPAGNLLLHPRDKDDQIYILVRLLNLPRVDLIGWIYGWDGKKREYWEDGTLYPAFKGRPCYRVPSDKLEPMEKIPRRK